MSAPPEDTSGTSLSSDLVYMRRLWLLRVSIVFVLAPLAPLLDPDRGRTVGYLAAFLWVPAVGLIDAARRRSSGRWLAGLVLVLDWTLLIGASLAIEELALLAALLQLPLVASYARQDARRLGTAAAALSLVVLAIALQALQAPAPLLAFGPAAFAVAVGGLWWLQREADEERLSADRHLRRLHGRSRAIMSGVGEAVVVTDVFGLVRELNPAAARSLDVPVAIPAGATCEALLRLRDGLELLQCSQGCALLSRPGGASGDARLTRRLATGVEQPLLAGASQVGRGSDAEIVHSFRDITRLRQAEEAKSLFLATASHELKTPLAVIRGFSELMLTERLDPEMKSEALEAIHRRTIDLGNIVDRLLLSSRIESGRVELVHAAVPLMEVLHERVRALDAVSTHKLVVRAPDAVADVGGDAVAVATVVDHLLENAIKYSPDGGTIEVDVRERDRTVEIDVTDHGIGMTEEQQERCFDHFWQAEGGDIRRFGGTGIGLYVVQSLARGMGGDVAVASQPGLGSTFTVTLGVHGAPQPRTDVDASAGDANSDRGATSIIMEFMRHVGVEAGGRP